MPIANLLTALSNDLGPDPIPAANVRTAFDRLFGAWRNRLDGLQPTQQETEQFITLMMRAVQAEAKPRSNARLQALTKLRVFNATPGQIVFSEMDPHVVAFQLALRIREPALIDQSELGLCGGNSLMVHFARKSPEGYAEYAISLLKTGSGKFHSMDVAPSLATKWGWFTGKMAAADIVALGSLGLGLIDKVVDLGASPGTLTSWLKKAGFQNAMDKTFTVTTAFSTNALLENLNEAAADVTSGRLVVIAADGDLQQYMHAGKVFAAGTAAAIRKSGAVATATGKVGPPGGIKPKDGLIRRTNHFTLVSRLRVSNNRVDIKLYTWGHSMQRSLDLNAFLTYYGGYVVAW